MELGSRRSAAQLLRLVEFLVNSPVRQGDCVLSIYSERYESDAFMKQFLMFGVLAVAGFATQADAFTAFNGARVNQVDNVLFEVIPSGRVRNGDYWCAAGEFARRALGAGWTDRVYIARERGQSVTTQRRTALQFTLNPDAAGITPLPTGGFKSGLPVGDSMSIQQAEGYCDPVPITF